MSFYISDIYCYLKEEQRKKLERQLNIIFPKRKCDFPSKKIKRLIQSRVKSFYINEFKKNLIAEENNLLKKIFLEGGFVEKEIYDEFNSKPDFPLIEFNQYIYLPNEFYELFIHDNFFSQNRYLIGLLRFLPERELRNWLRWLESYTSIPAYLTHSLKNKNNLIRFYFYVLLSPITLNININFSKKEYSFDEFWKDIDTNPLVNLSRNNVISYYKFLMELDKSEMNESISISGDKVPLKNLVIYFLSGKLVPLYQNNEIKKILMTSELRDVEISYIDNSSKIYYFNSYKKRK